MRGFGATWAPINHGHIATVGGLTDTGRALRAYCEKHGAKLLVLDTLAHALTLEENSRALVTLALEAWAGWAAESGCAVMLSGHPSKASAGEAADYSGTTAWRGSVRVLWTLRRPDADEDAVLALEGDSRQPERVARLTLNKNNYGFDDVGLDMATVGHRASWQLVGPIESKKRPSLSTNGGNMNGQKTNPYA